LGDYLIVYNVTDSAGNPGEIGRVVRVAGSCSGEGEGEGEGEIEPSQQLAQALLDAFESVDTDVDGAIDFLEAQGLFAALTQAEFDALDGDGDGEVSQAELIAAGAVLPAKGGCFGGGKVGKVVSDIKNFFGELFVLGLLSIVFVVWGRFGVRP